MPGLEINCLLLFITEVNEWTTTATPGIRLHGLDTENFAFLITCTFYGSKALPLEAPSFVHFTTSVLLLS